MSPREFDGATPVEVHEHYDAAGEYTGYTVVTRESMWDDDARGRALRLAEYEESLCPCGCGQPMTVAHDPKQVWRVESFTCGAQRAMTVERRAKSKEHEKDTRPGWDDGLNYYAVPHEPD